ncbi:polysaccharide pyruvyl transferase family protein [Rheinheimera sp.]|uniref:polysaccharide pyruvyl transferase family protein n=1 Tax=Rheinheimera sp. TaxID=1869214 RepID=UPI0027361853|nr:polysaccharide pyruvyl transferase family protein [Rheinheimera sp.]MDP2715862.1 polysaccharide pyruvyl transferase family protein [Rheinheimera sp.]
MIKQQSDATEYASKHFLLAGYVGGINVGDEILTSAVAAHISQKYSNHITIASGQPALSKTYIGDNYNYVEAYYPGQPLNVKGLSNLISAIRRADSVVFVGGGLLQDAHSTRLIQHCAFIASIAKVMNKPVMSFGVGAGPIKSTQGVKLSNLFLQANDVIYCRDSYSVKYIQQHLVPKPNTVKQGYDSIFLQGQHLAEKAEQKIIGLCYRHWPGLEQSTLLRLTEQLIDNQYAVLFMPYEKSDIALYHALKQRFGDNIQLSGEQNTTATLDTIASLHGLISMRLHANLLAILAAVPCVALSYDPKLSSVLASVGCEQNVLPLSASAEDILHLLQHPPPAKDHKLLQQAIANNAGCFNDALSHSFAGKTSFSAFKKVALTAYWYNSLVLAPATRRAAVAVAPAFNKLLPGSLKAWIRRKLGFNW